MGGCRFSSTKDRSFPSGRAERLEEPFVMEQLSAKGSAEIRAKKAATGVPLPGFVSAAGLPAQNSFQGRARGVGRILFSTKN